MQKNLLVIFSLFISQTLFAATWQLDNSQSTLNFNSTKLPQSISAVPITETSKFDHVTGTIDEKGNATFVVDLTSVDTNIPLRDDRLKEILFDVKKYPTATFTTQLNMDEITKDADMKPHQVDINGTLDFHGVQHAIKTQVTMQQIDSKTVRVTNNSPVTVNADQYNLSDGIKQLQDLMQLKSISAEVPVSFSLVFKEQ